MYYRIRRSVHRHIKIHGNEKVVCLIWVTWIPQKDGVQENKMVSIIKSLPQYLNIWQIIWTIEDGFEKLYIDKFNFLDHEWLQFDLGPPTTVTGLITRGQGDKKRYVTSYSMSYSNDSSTWYFYKDANHLESKVSAKFLIWNYVSILEKSYVFWFDISNY